MTKKQKSAKRKKRAYVKKCADYARFLKDDHDFDWTYILLLLRYKLSRTRQCIANGITMERDKYAAEIKEVEDLLWRVTEHGYEEEAFAAFHKKHGHPKAVFLPHTKDSSRIEFIYRNGKTATKAMSSEHMRLYKLADDNQLADIKKAFGIMADKIRHWWD